MFKNALARSVLALGLLMSTLLTFATGAFALAPAGSSPAAPAAPTSILAKLKEEKAKLGGEPTCKPDDDACAQGRTTFLIRVACRTLSWALRNTLDDIVRLIARLVGPELAAQVGRWAAPVAGVLDELAELETATLEMVYGFTFRLLYNDWNQPRVVATNVALAVKNTIQFLMWLV